MTYFLALFKMENGNKDPQEYPLIIIECQEKKKKHKGSTDTETQ